MKALAEQDTITRSPSPSLLRLERRIVLALLVLPPLGVAAAIAWAWTHGISRADVAVFVVMYATTAFGITVGYHRLLTHRSFACPSWLTALFAIAGSMALQGPAIRWVADHRRHHFASESPSDPHSPYAATGKTLGHASGLWHAHVGWLFDERKTRASRFARDLLADPVIRGVDRLYLVWALASLALPALLGWLASGLTAHGAISGLLFGGFARIFLVHHVTWSINSICHWYGSRPFRTSDASRDNVWLSLLSFGESWHNHHHAFPSAAIYPDLRSYQIDISGRLIWTLERVGLATQVKRPSANQIARKRDSEPVPAPQAEAA